jgi:N-acetylmuramoyl-L-alanine amidase
MNYIQLFIERKSNSAVFSMMTALLIFFLSASGSISDNTAYAISQPESIQAEAKQTSADVQTVKDELRLFGEDDNKKIVYAVESSTESSTDNESVRKTDSGNDIDKDDGTIKKGNDDDSSKNNSTDSDCKAPSDVPSGLKFCYNEKMKLDLTDEEITMIEKIVEAEAGVEDIYGKMLVANVIINRVNSTSFPDTVKGVIFAHKGSRYQFSTVRTKKSGYYTVKVSDETKEAVRRVLSGEDYSSGAVYFFQRSATSASNTAWFDTLTRVAKYGSHEFFI